MGPDRTSWAWYFHSPGSNALQANFTHLTLSFDLESGSYTWQIVLLCWALVPNDMKIGLRMQVMFCKLIFY